MWERTQKLSTPIKINTYDFFCSPQKLDIPFSSQNYPGVMCHSVSGKIQSFALLNVNLSIILFTQPYTAVS